MGRGAMSGGSRPADLVGDVAGTDLSTVLEASR